MMMLQHLPVVSPASAPSGATSVIYRHDSEHELHRTYHSRSSSPVHHTSYVQSRDRSPVIIKRTYSTEDLKHYHPSSHHYNHQHHRQMSPRDDMVDSDGDHHRIMLSHRHSTSEPSSMHNSRSYLIRHIDERRDDEYERRSPMHHDHEDRHDERERRYVVYREEEVIVEDEVKREPSVEMGPTEEHEELEQDPDAPLDLSMKFKRNRHHSDSGSDSESDTSRHGQQRSAYKKSLMKRYCE
uniref:CSON000200 protein n=1 Tax=Culicoides sonorensis TaxID=179676 RepID=A0A336KVM1_CULSO